MNKFLIIIDHGGTVAQLSNVIVVAAKDKTRAIEIASKLHSFDVSDCCKVFNLSEMVEPWAYFDWSEQPPQQESQLELVKTNLNTNKIEFRLEEMEGFMKSALKVDFPKVRIICPHQGITFYDDGWKECTCQLKDSNDCPHLKK